MTAEELNMSCDFIFCLCLFQKCIPCILESTSLDDMLSLQKII